MKATGPSGASTKAAMHSPSQVHPSATTGQETLFPGLFCMGVCVNP